MAKFGGISVEKLQQMIDPFTAVKPKDAALRTVKNLNIKFQEIYNTNFTDIITKIP